jgi:DUF1680 family protein
MGHLMTLATTYYRVSGSRTLLDVAIKAADFLDQHFAVITPELTRIDFNPTHIMGLIEIYRSTGNKKYLDRKYSRRRTGRKRTAYYSLLP